MSYSFVLLILSALIPSIIIMAYVFGKDRVEKEPIGRLIALFIFGCLASIPVVLLSDSVENLFKSIVEVKNVGTFYLYVLITIAMLEEGFKFLVLVILTWKAKSFNCLFDGIVYAVFVSIGFATLENVLYVVLSKSGGFDVAMIRAISAVPGHAINAVFMGALYGMAKYYSFWGRTGASARNIILALIVPMLTHAFYDTTAMLKSEKAEWIWLAFVVVSTIVAICVIRRFSKKDDYIDLRSQKREAYE